MKLEFEKWLASQNIGEAVEDTFQEAVSCYKSGAYRAALLLSYVGFLSILRDRILSTSVPPTGISTTTWDKIIAGVKDDDNWDSTVFNATQRRSTNSVLDVSDDIRQQVLYWKNRRNDCAHSKRNEITNAHVEAFWQFMQSNLPKFVVRESRDSLLNRIRTHFDRSVTPAGKDVGYLVEQIPDAVEPDDIPSFLDEVYAILESAFFISLEERGDFFARLLNLKTIAEHVVSFLKSKEELLVEILRANPNYLLLLAEDARFMRRLWYQHLFRQRRDDIHLYCSLLRNGLIPVEQKEEAHRLMIRRMPDSWPGDECFQLLEQTAFFEIFRDMVFIDEMLADSFGWANYHTNMVIKYLEHFGIDAETAKSLRRIFSKENYPYDLRDALDRMFFENDDMKNEMLQCLVALQLSVPKYLESLQSD